MKKSVQFVACCLMTGLATTACIWSQEAVATDAVSGGSSSRSFDVVMIRPSPERGPDSGRQFIRSNEYFTQSRPLGYTVLAAYLPPVLEVKENLLNAPGWLWDENFDLTGTVSSDDMPEWTRSQRHRILENPLLQAMLQNALRERCKLSVHFVTVERDGLALVRSARPLNLNPGGSSAVPVEALDAPGGGHFLTYWPGEDPKGSFYGVSMDSFAAQLSAFAGEIVENRTGITGNHDFVLKVIGGFGDGSVGYDLRTIGLEVKPVKVKVSAVSIDHIEEPTSN